MSWPVIIKCVGTLFWALNSVEMELDSIGTRNDLCCNLMNLVLSLSEILFLNHQAVRLKSRGEFDQLESCWNFIDFQYTETISSVRMTNESSIKNCILC